MIQDPLAQAESRNLKRLRPNDFAGFISGRQKQGSICINSQ